MGTTDGAQDRLYFLYGYDSFGNIAGFNEKYNNGTLSTYYQCYDNQNRLVRAFAPFDSSKTCSTYTTGQVYAYDNAGRMTSYEGAANTFNTIGPIHAVKNSGYTYDANGNMKTRPGQTLVWNVENRLESVAGETYLYDENGVRIKKTVGGVNTFYPFAHYEVTGATATKYYSFNGMLVAERQGSTLYYLHTDHLSSVALTTTSTGAIHSSEQYYAYGKRDRLGAGAALPTSMDYTGQRRDGSGLLYFQARYYDPAVGVFVSPDSIVPDAGSVFAYNRFMLVHGNPLNGVDPTGHCGPPYLCHDMGRAGGRQRNCWRRRQLQQQWVQLASRDCGLCRRCAGRWRRGGGN
ncbi:MAG: RHS repeat-associated core domain-containing protein [Caldilineaceae bacterium]